MTLNDNSPMPYGSFEGKPMRLLPLVYLHEIWNNVQAWTEDQIAVKEYIKENLARLRAENPRLIWKR